ncbi:hypothetical protein GYMLUDRAFT_245557 [Collybiopsis luxurians FD-317 M1]|uniref:Endonuclease/exonuclease/phosphatase domain-containing protein n=1 Tax=Collybiopsis luxurians FD-317 M1 TaxID=944289 RepID=A0A0D0CKW8_9AGAR|nr:hypothetical protein GYMLUDRAFT_245557 [Collybiopsis luxurians FD-317 M1]
MAVQETHLSSTQAQEIQDSYIGKNLKIFSSLDPSRPNAASIAIALNYNLVNTETDIVKTYNLIPGHALCITVPFSGKETFTSLAVYAPNESMTANWEFWNDLTKKWLILNLPVPDQILGDTNIVEEAPDQSNNRTDDQSAVAALTQFKNLFRLKDGWRAINPSEWQYTHVHQGQNGCTSMSQIDHIYISENLQLHCNNWEISDEFAHMTDHSMVSVVVNTPGIPYQGKGRYTMSPKSLENPHLIKTFSDIGYAMEDQCYCSADPPSHSDNCNPQLFLQRLKEEMVKEERQYRKKTAGSAHSKMQALQKKKTRYTELPTG